MKVCARMPVHWHSPITGGKATSAGFFGDGSMKSPIKMSVFSAARISIKKNEKEKKKHSYWNGAYLFTQQLIKADKLIKSLLLRLQYHVRPVIIHLTDVVNIFKKYNWK